LNHIPAIYDIDVFQRGYIDPFLTTVVPDFETVLAWLLEQNGHAAEIGVSANAELTFGDVAAWRVSDHFHGYDWPLRELGYRFGRLIEALE
jgi:hypothetical protein